MMLKYIKRLVGKNSKKLICPIVLSIVDSFFNSMMYGVVLATFTDLSTKGLNKNRLLVYTLILFGVFLARCIIQAIGFTQAQIIGPTISRKLRLDVGNHIRSLNLGFFNKNSIGRLNSVLSSDISEYEVIITHCMCDFIKVVSFSILSVVFSYVISVKFGFCLTLLLLLALPFLILSGKVSGSKSQKLRITRQNLISRLIEYVNGIMTFRLYNLTGTKFKRLDKELVELKNDSTRSELAVLPLSMGFYTIISLIIPLAIIIGGLLIQHGELDVVRLIILLLLAVSISEIMGILSSLYPQIKSITKASENICNILDEKPFEFDSEIKNLSNFDIRFDNVNFSYESNVRVLRDLNFSAKEGTKTALIGSSGSGKSTIVSLLSRFWDVSSGSIKIGGIDIKNISPDVIANNMSIVFQDVYLLNDTIKNNIKIGKPDATDEEVYEACKAACCHDFILKTEKGYDTMVGEGGSTLSGGEKQRISIARALLKNAPIVLLDETTSNLDADNEKEIQQAFETLMKGKTVIVIAHRLNTIRNADNIIVLKNGCIIEQGSHAELLKNNGWYSNICIEQDKAKKWEVKN